MPAKIRSPAERELTGGADKSGEKAYQLMLVIRAGRGKYSVVAENIPKLLRYILFRLFAAALLGHALQGFKCVHKLVTAFEP